MARWPAWRVLALSWAMAAWPARAATDLMTGWQAARSHDAAYAAARAGQSAGQARAEQARALWRPMVQAGVGLGWAEQASTTTGAGFAAPGFGSAQNVAFRTQVEGGTAQSWNLQLQQPLLNAGRRASAAQLELQAAVADEALRAARQALMLRVARAHLAVLSAQDAGFAARAEEATALRALDEAREAFAAGAIPVTAVHEAQARSDAVASRVLAAQDAVTLARADYAELTGLPAHDLAPLKAQALPSPGQPAPSALPVQPAGSLDDWLSQADQNSPQLSQARIAAEMARAEVGRHTAWAAPTLDLVARAGEDRLRGDGSYAADGTQARQTGGSRWVGLQLNVPLYAGGMRSAQRQEAAAQVEQALAQGRVAEVAVRQQVRSAWLALSTGAAQVRAAAQARFSAAQRLDATRVGYEVGDRTMLDRLDAERDLQAAELAWRQARQALLLARLQLAAAAGTLDEGQLAEVNQALDLGTSNDAGPDEGRMNPP